MVTASTPAGVVLMVGSNPAVRARLEGLGHRVIACRGPGATGKCSILDTGRCGLVDAADGIVFDLDLTDPRHRRILVCYSRRPTTGPIAALVDEHCRAVVDGMPGVSAERREPGEAELQRLSAQLGLAAAARRALSGPSCSAQRM